MVQRLRHLHDTQEIEGSIPSAITDGKWFVSVPGARVLGKNEDRVRFSNEPLQSNIKWGHGPAGRHRHGMAKTRVRISVRPFCGMYLLVNITLDSLIDEAGFS